MSTTISAQLAVVDDRLQAATLTIADGRITAVSPGTDPEADVQLDDQVVLMPGGVDTHVHLNEPGRTEWEGLATGTLAASLGGVTTVLDMPLNSVPSTTTPEALVTKREAAEGQLSVDLGYWGGAVPQNLGRLEELWRSGVFGFKCFTLPSGVDEFEPLDPQQFLAAQREIAGFDGLLIVHAEDAHTIESAPHQGSKAYADFLASRPDEAELVAIRQVIDGVRETGCRTHLLHLSSARALDLLAEARAEGLPLSVETCPHYLCLASETIPDASPQFKCCPPIRDAGNADELWAALDEGIIDMVVTDHSPATAEQKFKGDGDLQLAWGGIAGLQVGYSAVLHHAALRGFGPERVARWMATNTAQVVGVPGKGAIAKGHDADLALYRPGAALEVSVVDLAHKNPISAWDGAQLSGRFEQVWLRGQLVSQGQPMAPVASLAGRDFLRTN
ncbi:allantoinase AllB [Luteococcus peritonei]|uniref:allantoinase n=1 Tax=Luteococcus peritonei TaxID=88874 RepID=A0ABW4RYH9_9ACTN